MTIEEQLKELIIERYDTVINFSKYVGIPNSSIAGILKRGINNSTVDNIIKICNELHISADALADGKIVPTSQSKETEKTLDQFVAELKREIASQKNVTIGNRKMLNTELSMLSDFIEMGAEIIKRDKSRNDQLAIHMLKNRTEKTQKIMKNIKDKTKVDITPEH